LIQLTVFNKDRHTAKSIIIYWKKAYANSIFLKMVFSWPNPWNLLKKLCLLLKCVLLHYMTLTTSLVSCVSLENYKGLAHEMVYLIKLTKNFKICLSMTLLIYNSHHIIQLATTHKSKGKILWIRHVRTTVYPIHAL
jgi:hypothetical protein